VFGALPNFLTLLPYPLWGLGTVLLTWSIGRRLGGRRAGLLAGVLLQATFGFINLHNKVVVDSQLLFWVTFSMLFLLKASRDGRFSSFALFYLGLACGTLSKGLLGLCVPGGAALVWFLAEKRPLALFRRSSGGWQAVAEVFAESAHRFSSGSADHSSPFYYYVRIVPHLLAPCSIALPFLLWRLFTLKLSRARFAAIWFFVVLIGLSLASAKRTMYLSPLLPALPLWTALWWKEVRLGELASKVEAWAARALPRAAPFLLLAFVIGFAAQQVFYRVPRSRRESLRPYLEVVAEHRDRGALHLLKPSHSLSGAVVLYLGERVPVLKEYDDVLDALREHPGGLLIAGQEKHIRLVLPEKRAFREERLHAKPVGKGTKHIMELWVYRP